jgi:hypothetical protein
LAESEDKCQKNQPQTSKNQLSSNVSLLCIIFEDLGCDIKLHVKFADEVAELHSWTQEILSSMDKKEEMIVTIFFLGRVLSMKPKVPTRNIYSFMNCGVCLHKESSTNICLQYWMSSVYVYLEKRQVSQTDFANTLVCMMMKEYTHI